MELQSTLALASQDDAISACNTFAGESSPSYSCTSFCSSHTSNPLPFESNVSLETFSVSNFPVNSSNSTSSRRSSFSSESEDINQESIHTCRKPTGIASPSSDNHTQLGNLDTSLGKTNALNYIPRDLNTRQNYSSDFHTHTLLFLQPDGNNTWTLSLDPTISHPETISESSLELESSSACASDYDDEAIARPRSTIQSVHFTPRNEGSYLSLPPLQAGTHDIAGFSSASDVSMIVSSTSSIQQAHGEGTVAFPFSTGSADLNMNGLSHDFPIVPQQPSRSKKLVKKSKDIFGRLKKLFTPKGTLPEDMQAHSAHPPTNAEADAIPQASGRRFLPSLLPWSSYQRSKLSRSRKFSTLSMGQSFSPEDTSHTDNNVDEKYTYGYHARPKTLKEIKAQRRFSLPMGFVGTSSRATSSTIPNITASVPHSQSRPMSMYITTQSEALGFAAQLRHHQ